MGRLSPSLSLALGWFHPHIEEFIFERNFIELSFLVGGSETPMICVSRESSVTEPSVVMRNMRQVMNGLKNYTGQLPDKEIIIYF